jgi:hypothetical protein
LLVELTVPDAVVVVTSTEMGAAEALTDLLPCDEVGVLNLRIW